MFVAEAAAETGFGRIVEALGERFVAEFAGEGSGGRGGETPEFMDGVGMDEQEEGPLLLFGPRGGGGKNPIDRPDDVLIMREAAREPESGVHQSGRLEA